MFLSVGQNVVFGQFWEGFLYGLGQAAENYSNQRQYNNNRNSNNTNSRNTQPEITKTRQIESDGYVWYKLKKTNVGIEDTNGRVILPPEYHIVSYDEDGKVFEITHHQREAILSKSGTWIIPLNREYESCYYSKDGVYYVKKNGYEGVCNANGREIIAPDRYESCFYYPKDGVYYVKKNGYEGVCDANGREIIAPDKYESIIYSGGQFKGKDSTGKYVELKIDINGNHIDTQNSMAGTQNTPFKLQERRFYKVESLLLDNIPLPYEAEISVMKFGDNYTIQFCEGDGNGNVDVVEFFDAKYSEKNGISIYTLTGKMGQDGVTGTLMLRFLKNAGKVNVRYHKTKNGDDFTNEFLMDPTPNTTVVLKRP